MLQTCQSAPTLKNASRAAAVMVGPRTRPRAGGGEARGGEGQTATHTKRQHATKANSARLKPASMQITRERNPGAQKGREPPRKGRPHPPSGERGRPKRDGPGPARDPRAGDRPREHRPETGGTSRDRPAQRTTTRRRQRERRGHPTTPQHKKRRRKHHLVVRVPARKSRTT